MLQDAQGLTLTTKSSEAAAAYRRCLDAFFEYRVTAMPLLKEALAADPDFFLGHVTRGCLFMLFGVKKVYPAVDASIAEAERCKEGATPRELLHLAALKAWRAGDWRRAVAHWAEITALAPHDVFALRLQHGLLFWMGESRAQAQALYRVLPAWSEKVPRYGNLLGMLAFALEESGDYASAEKHGREACARDPEDLWAIHAVAHVLEMQRRSDDGLTWLSQPLDIWADRNPFKGHVWWHRALFHLAKGEINRVLDLYDHAFRAERSEFYLDIQNAAAMLARLALLGHKVGDRWDELADYAETNLGGEGLLFTELHSAMALAATGRQAAGDKLLAYLDGMSKEPGFEAQAAREAGTALARGILAFGRGDYDDAVQQLLPVVGAEAQVGGSHAQRDIFALYLMSAAQHAGQTALADQIAQQRAVFY